VSLVITAMIAHVWCCLCWNAADHQTSSVCKLQCVECDCVWIRQYILQQWV